MSNIDRREFLLATGATASLAALSNPLPGNANGVRVVGLKVDYLDRPLGLENVRPSLSWRMESDARNVRQSAYRILVAGSEAVLKARRGDLWDSGRVDSRKSFGIQYQGRELTSRQRCWWCVQVWDEQRRSGYSDTAWWEMGLLAEADWQAQWLAAEDAVAKADRHAGLHWIWGAAAQDPVSRKFRRTLNLPTAARGGVLWVGAQDRMVGVWIDGKRVSIEAPPRYSSGVLPLNEISLEPLIPGHHVLAVEVLLNPNEVSSPAAGMTAFMRLDLEDGTTLRITSGPAWRTRLSEDPQWSAPQYDDHAWESARASLIEATQPWPPAPAMHLRKEFRVERDFAHARLFATALGGYEVRLNGRRVGDALLTPESTLYSKRVLYRVYDVSDLLGKGLNTLGLTVGDGWYASDVYPFGRYAWGPPPRRVLAQLELTLTDGSRETVATGPGWRIAASPILRSEIYNGEVYDARRQSSGWDTAGFDDSRWENVQIAEKPSCRLAAQVSPPIRATQVLKPRAIENPVAGIYVFDLGQNFAGWCRLRTKGPAGTRIEMRFAEVLLPSGEVDQSNLRGARQTDVFILRGDAIEEIFEPHFTYHGFRYVQISGLPAVPTASTLEGVVIHSDLRITGNLRTDNALIQQLWRNTVWTQRSNFMGIPTDCPQRDERLGYLGDAGIFWDAAAFNMDVDAFTRRYMDTAADSQTPAGVYPPYAPIPSSLYPAIPAIPGFADGGVILPWTIWQRYGDLAIIEQDWERMDRYLQFILKNNPDHIWRNERLVLADWQAVDEKYFCDPTTTPDLVSTAYWAHSAELLAQMAAAIGRGQDAASLRNLHDRIRHAFSDAFVKADGRVGNESQTGYVLALKYGLVADAVRPAAAEHLVADIRRRGGALSTGFLGTQYLLDVLADTGYPGVVFDLLLKTEYPSWEYMIDQGATTMWESWNGKVWTGSKSETMPNSYNHYALGAVCGFLFRRVAGIDAATLGFETIVVRPLLDPRVKQGGGDYDSVMGPISTDWDQRADGSFTLGVKVPANASAHIHLPARRNSRIEEGGKNVSHSRDMRIVNRLDHETLIEVGSGVYRFSVSS